MRQKIFLGCSLLAILLAGCAVKPPKGWVCSLNASGGYNLCFDLQRDFDAAGKVKKGVAGQRVPVKSLDEMHTRINIDVDSFANLKAYILKLKKRHEQETANCSIYGSH